ncbi:hypothetical protein [Gemmatimonas aurantiaca]|nr:hypothetical protein [Gemmatimonas aurantiaca]
MCAQRSVVVVALLAAALGVRGRTATAQPTVPPSTLGTPSGSRVQAGKLVRPDTVEIGDPFTLIVTVVVPTDARIEWPTITDTAATVAMRAPVKVIDEGTNFGGRRERAEYTLSAWDIGTLHIDLPDAVVRYGDVTMRVPMSDARVFVKSVLPGDTTLHVPKPARDLFPRVLPWWQRWWPALLVIAGLGLLWWLWRRLRRRKLAVAAAPPLDPYARAIHEFDRLDRLALAEAGESGRYVALAVDILRLFVAARLPDVELSQTSAELLVAAIDDPRVPRDRLISLLADADGIKFAARRVSPPRAREIGGEARAIVEHFERVDRERRAAEAAATAAAIAAEANARQELEDRARRDSRRPKSGAR